MDCGGDCASIAAMPDMLQPHFGPGWLRTLAAGFLATLVLLGASSANAALLIRISHVVAEETPKGLAMHRFKELVEQRSAGQIRVVVYPAGQLYGDHDEIEALRLGAVDMLAPSLSKFGRIGFPEFELFDLPFLFDSVQSVRRITQGPIGQRLLERLSRQGMTGLGYLDNGFKQMSANRPLLAPADFRGLRMRVQPSRVIATQFMALGARPIRLNFSETRQALASGVVDGTENPISNFWTQRMHEVQSDLTLTNHGYLGYAVVTNQRFWRSLSPPEKLLLERALGEALDYGNQIADIQNDKAMAALREAGSTRIHTLTSAQRTALRRSVQPAYDELAQRIGNAWLEEFQSAGVRSPK